MLTSGWDSLNSYRMARTCCYTGSRSWATEGGPAASEMKFDMQEMMTQSDSLRIDPNDSAKMLTPSHGMICEAQTSGFAQQVFLFTWR